jgi:glycosyltransferase involved in cell wall biosynthesis
MTIKPRILFVIGILWGKNGVTLHLETLAKKLQERGWEVGIASGVPSASRLVGEKAETISAIQKFKAMGIEHFLIPFPTLHFSFSDIKNSFEALLKLNTAIRKFKPDVIHIHSFSSCPFVYLMRLVHHIPYVSTCHLEPSNSHKNIVLAGLANDYFRAIFGDRVIAISTDIKNAFERMKVPPESIRLIYHGVDNEHFCPPSPQEHLKAREMFGLSPNSKVVCFVGRLDVAVKGHDVLICAISKLRLEGLEVIVLCAGQGHGIGENIVQTLASEAGVSDLVRLLGFADTRQVLWASDVLTLPSRREGFPLVIPETMLCGVVPVRTPAAGAFDQIEDGVNGFIVPFDDPEALALRLKQLLEDENLRGQMSATAIATARQKFTVDRMISDTVAVYEEVIHKDGQSTAQDLLSGLSS